VDNPEAFGIATLRADGTLEALVEKPKGLPAPQMANAGAYVFPEDVFRTELTLSPREEYEITQYVSAEAARGHVRAVRSRFWLPIGDVAAWRAAEGAPLNEVMRSR
jgi:dTDP-glucose pyrophosphorylase